MNFQKTRGFTLIELLTVIAIIGILAAILIPVVGAVRESARNANCVSNLRQISMAMVAAGEDYGHRFPPSAREYEASGSHPQPHLQGLMEVLKPYLEKGAEEMGGAAWGAGVWRCESNGIPRPVQWSYYENGAIWRPGSSDSQYFAHGRPLDSVPELSRFPVISDRGSGGVSGPWGHWGGYGTMFQPQKGWHSGNRLNVGFADASVRGFVYEGSTDTSSEFHEILVEANPVNW